MREIVILGSTGSIGVQALEVIAANPDKFKVIALSAGGSNIPTLIAQARKFGVGIIGVLRHSSQRNNRFYRTWTNARRFGCWQ